MTTAAPEKKSYTPAESKAHEIAKRQRAKSAHGLLTGELAKSPKGVSLADLQAKYRAEAASAAK